MKYPSGVKVNTEKIVLDNHAHRGMSLEHDLNISNEYYREKDMAYIYKKPTPIKLSKVDYKKGIIKEAFFEIPSTTDYNGIYKGKYIDYEAKETSNKTSFPLANIHTHQLKHLEAVHKHGGISFLIVRFNTKGETYLLEEKKILDFLNNNTRKSIPYEYFKQEGYLIEEKYHPRIDYLKIIDIIMEV